MRLITVFSAAALLIAPIASAQTPGNPSPPRVPQVNNSLRLGGSAGDYQRRLATNALERDQNQEPTPQELNEQLSDGAGAAVSAQPTDEHPGDLDDARTRAGWDESTDDGAGLDEAERGQ